MAVVQPHLENDQAGVLSRVDLLDCLSPEERRELWSLGAPRAVRAHERVVEQGEVGSEVFLVLCGRLRVLTSSPEDKHLAEAILGPGEVFGEIALLDDLPRTASVEAMDDSEVLSVPREEFLPFLQRHPRIALDLLRVLASKMRRLCRFVDDTQFLGLPVRLAKRLLELSSLYGIETDRGLLIELKLTQTELGALVGATRESVNKQLRDWEEKEIVETCDGHLLLHRLDELEAVAHRAAG